MLFRSDEEWKMREMAAFVSIGLEFNDSQSAPLRKYLAKEEKRLLDCLRELQTDHLREDR
jgi:hypothetical protein